MTDNMTNDKKLYNWETHDDISLANFVIQETKKGRKIQDILKEYAEEVSRSFSAVKYRWYVNLKDFYANDFQEAKRIGRSFQTKEDRRKTGENPYLDKSMETLEEFTNKEFDGNKEITWADFMNVAKAFRSQELKKKNDTPSKREISSLNKRIKELESELEETNRSKERYEELYHSSQRKHLELVRSVKVLQETAGINLGLQEEKKPSYVIGKDGTVESR